MEKITNQVVDKLQAKFGPDAKITTQKVFETNIVYTGISLTLPDIDFSPTVCVEFYPENYTVEKIVDDFVGVYQEILQQPAAKSAGMRPPASKDEVLNKVTLQVVNQQLNGEMLEACPHIRFLDIAGVFRHTIFHEKFKHRGILITNKMMDSLGITLPELEAAARENTLKMFGIRFYGTEDFERGDKTKQVPVPKPLDEAIFGPGDNVITTAECMNGAALMLFPDVLRRLGEMAGGDYLIVPCSIHELSVIRDTGDGLALSLAISLRTRNRTPSITPRDVVLSDRIYRYHFGTGEVEIVI